MYDLPCDKKGNWTKETRDVYWMVVNNSRHQNGYEVLNLMDKWFEYCRKIDEWKQKMFKN